MYEEYEKYYNRARMAVLNMFLFGTVCLQGKA